MHRKVSHNKECKAPDVSGVETEEHCPGHGPAEWNQSENLSSLLKEPLACLRSPSLRGFGLLPCYSEVPVTGVPAASPFLYLFTLVLTRNSSDIVTSVALKHQKVLFWPQNGGAMQCEETETGFGLKELGFSLGPTIS